MSSALERRYEKPSLDLGHGISQTSVSLRFPDGLDAESWQRVGEQLARLGNATGWWIGDWLNYGEPRYGSSYQDMVEMTGLEYGTIRNYASVAGRYKVSRRRDTLSFAHHAEALGCKTESEQEEMLDLAEALGWSKTQLREEVAARRKGLPIGQGRFETEDERFSTGLARMLGVSEEKPKRWRLAAERRGLELNEWLVRVADEAAEAA